MTGLYCAVVKKNMVKIVVGLAIMEYAVNLFLVMLGYRVNGLAPIVLKKFFESETAHVSENFVNNSVDPLPQAIVLIAIVISLCTLSLTISMCIRIYEKCGNFDVTQLRRLKG